MITQTDPITTLAERILRDLNRRRVRAHQKLQSERKLAALFNTTPNRVHRALQHLSQRGIVYTRAGSGTFIADLSEAHRSEADRKEADREVHSKPLPPLGHVDSIVPSQFVHTLSVAIPVGGDVSQQRAWQRAIESFNHEYPFIEVKLSFDLETDPGDSRHDVVFLTPSQLRREADSFAPLEPVDDHQVHPGILAAGRMGDETLALPVLRTATVYYAHMPTLTRCGIDVDELRHPADLFRAGAEIEKQTNDAVTGLFYWGVPFHAANVGVYFEKDSTGISFDRQRLADFLSDIKPFVKARHLVTGRRHNPADVLDGRVAIYPSILQDDFLAGAKGEVSLLPLPLCDDGFMLTGLFLAGVSVHSPHAQEARFFLDYLLRPQIQQLLVETHRSYLSVRNDVLTAQKQAEVYPPGSVPYDFDPRGISYQLDLDLYLEFPSLLATQTQKYILGVQGLDQTLDRLTSSRAGVRPRKPTVRA